MAFTVTQRVISSKDTTYSYCDNLCRKAKLLYNAALFRVRNVFTGYEKEHRTESLSNDPCPESDLLLSSGKADACDR